VVWHVGFEARTTKRAKFGSTSGQIGSADSNSRPSRDNNRSGKSSAFPRGYRGKTVMSTGAATQIFDAGDEGFGYTRLAKAKMENRCLASS
jgi:hypothetical protein